MLDRDAAPRKRPSPSLSGINVGSADIAAFLQFQTKYYSSTTLYYTVLQSNYYNVLLQYYSVLQTATPVLFRTTKYYSSTSPYDKVLLRTTTYYSTTILYYNVLLQY